MNDALLNLFNARYLLDEDILACFTAAFAVSPNLAVLTAFHLRDVRFNGRREAFRQILQWLADNAPEYFIRVASCIPEYGRWDDLLIFSGYKVPLVCDCVRNMVVQQLRQDEEARIAGNAVSLLAKYMPSENASSTTTRIFADYWINTLYPSFSTGRMRNAMRKRYRILLSSLRAIINSPERLMSNGQWQRIDYDHVPRTARRIYGRAFTRHDRYRYFDWLIEHGHRRVDKDVLPLTGNESLFDLVINSDRMESLRLALDVKE